jgi:protease IV
MRTALIVAIFLLGTPLAAAPPFAPHAERAKFHLAPGGAVGTGAHGYANPALLNYVDGTAGTLAWSEGGDDWASFNAIGRLGFGRIHRRLPGRDRDEFRLGIGLGNRAFGLGLGYGRSDPGKSHGVVGFLLRPSPRLSLGATLTGDFSAEAVEATVDMAVRPWGGQRLTLFAEAVSASDEAGGSRGWSAGAAVALLPGLEATGRFFDDESVSLGLRMGLGRWGLAGQSLGGGDQDRSSWVNAVELRSDRADALRALSAPPSRYIRLDLKGGLPYRRFALFDSGPTLRGLLQLLEQARRDPQIKGVALNLSGMAANPSIAWEVRGKLAQLRRAGKGVVVYIDRVRLWSYYFASVADRIVLDPQGMVALEGFAAGQTYYKGSLEKLGIGFEEWRYFDYKSAMESLARQDMSAAERHQTEALLGDLYGLVRDGICQARDLSPEGFDRLVNEHTLFMAQEALKAGLVDRVGRWEEVDKEVQKLGGGRVDFVDAGAYRPPSVTKWGELPRVAVVYALGVCDLDSGIRARSLARLLDSLSEDGSVAAVVLRVDSPGGDALAADLVAAAMRRLRQSKPVVVSQGYVAASGGYWLSMYADAIVAAPVTVTGSIGVIGGWAYNQGFKERLGVTTDKVQIGEHADLALGMRVPLLNFSLPDRNLDAEERERQEHAIRSLYRDFVAQVAVGRGREVDEIETLAQGRVWSGTAALANGLVDELGGLERAVELAAEKAGLPAGQEVEWLELPQRPLFDTGGLVPSLIDSRPPRLLPAALEYRLRHSGAPLVLLPLEPFGAMEDLHY